MNIKLIHERYATSPACPGRSAEEEVLDALPADPPPVTVDEHSLPGLIELLLKDPVRVDRLTREPGAQSELLPRFLAIALTSFSIYSLALVLVLNHVNIQVLPEFLRARWHDGLGPAVSLWSAYTFGLIAASGICLPTFYFFGLLAGVNASAVQVASHVMKGKAATAVMLLGVLPIYVAVMLGMIVFKVPPQHLQAGVYLGLLLPFLAGFWGAWSIFRGFMTLADTLPPSRRCRRSCFLRRLTVSWAAVYSVVTPVMIWTLWKFFADRLA